jgi:HEPN domain-containing protein
MRNRIIKQDQGLDAADLFRSARDHASAACALAKSAPHHLDSAGYLAHISVELALKAWLLHNDGYFRAIHSLESLYIELQERHNAPLLQAEVAYLFSELDKYSELRYPNRNSPTEVGQSEVADLPLLLNFIHAHYPVDLREAIERIDPLIKGGRVLMRKKS